MFTRAPRPSFANQLSGVETHLVTWDEEKGGKYIMTKHWANNPMQHAMMLAPVPLKKLDCKVDRRTEGGKRDLFRGFLALPKRSPKMR